MEITEEEIKCVVCGDKAIHETGYSTIYVCDEDSCILQAARENFLEGELE